MNGDASRENHPFGGFSLERTIKQDGRYLLYYTWPESGGGTAGDDLGTGVVAEPASEPGGAEREPSPGGPARADADGGTGV